MPVFGGDIEGKGVHYYKLQQKYGYSPQNEGLTNVWRSAITEIWDFTSFSAILASFQLKMAGFGGDIEGKGVHYYKLPQKCDYSG